MEYLFKKDIKDLESWGTIFQSIEGFKDLIKAIFVKHKLEGYDHISNLVPGSNAVFKVGEYVVKIFAPRESGLNLNDMDFSSEVDSLSKAIKIGIRTSKVIAVSEIADKYHFRYIIMEYIEGKGFSEGVNHYSREDKKLAVKELKEILNKLNTPPAESVNEIDVKQRIINNIKWNRYPKKLVEQVQTFVSQYIFSEFVHVHGDLTSDNVLVDRMNNIYVIDFADSTIAPKEYEYPPIIFDLFNFDKELITEFINGQKYQEFIDKLFGAILIHAFGGIFINIICNKYNKNIEEISDIFEVKKLIKDNLLYGSI